MTLIWKLLWALINVRDELEMLRREAGLLREEIHGLREDMKPPLVSAVRWHFGPPEGEA